MRRAAVSYKTKKELLSMSEEKLRAYILWLKDRASHLGTLPRRPVQKDIEVAEKYI
jgi:hypothetical protein